MLLKSCNRCGNLIPYGAVYCSECAPIVQREREDRLRASRLKSNKEYNKTRDPQYIRFYNSVEWKALAAKRLQDDGYRCQWCGKIADEVDHIIEIKTPEGLDLGAIHIGHELESIPISSIDAPRALVKAVADIYAATALTCEMTERIHSEALPLTYTQKTQLKLRGFGEEELLPWDHINVGVTKRFLQLERKRAYAETITPDCRHGCAGCGANCLLKEVECDA